MKRTVTELEEKLIGLGYKLVFKQYGGKHSQKVDRYIYFKQDEDGDLIKVVLDKKREEIITIGLNGVNFEDIEQNWLKVQGKIKKISSDLLSTKEFESPIKVA